MKQKKFQIEIIQKIEHEVKISIQRNKFELKFKIKKI